MTQSESASTSHFKTLSMAIAMSVTMVAVTGCGNEEEVNGNPTPDVFNHVPATSNIKAQGANAAYYDAELQAAFDILNGARGRCGFGYWVKDAALKLAAENHVSYMVQNKVLSHTEIPGRPAFTGREVSDRAYAAGFDARYGVGELAGYGGAAEVANNLLAATYHLGGVISSTQKIGMAFESGYFSAELADTQYLGQRLAKNQVATYPCQGEVIAPNHAAESPNPVPGRDATSLGSPFAIKTRDGQKLNVTSYEISLNGAPIQASLLNSENDPNGVIVPSYAYVLPLSPLASGATYAFKAAGDVDGVKFAVAYTVGVR
jgi:uncharacterized protein YkwD